MILTNTTYISSVRTIEDRTQMFRWLDTGDKLVLQVACPYHEGFNGGIEWRDIPVVKSAEVLK